MPLKTLLRPAADTDEDEQSSKAPIERILELVALEDVGPDVFTNARELWHPPGARGVYGGAVIAQSLAAAQKTIPVNRDAVFHVHSMHCYFVLPGDWTVPMLYYIERVREGKSFITRTVQAQQRGKCIFTASLSFMREGSGGKQTVDHEWAIPDKVLDGLEAASDEPDDRPTKDGNLAKSEPSPFITRHLPTLNGSSPHPQTKRTRQWVRAHGPISSASGSCAHLAALAYVSDSFFVATAARAHNLWSTSHRAAKVDSRDLSHDDKSEKHDGSTAAKRPSALGMMVSLDHTIYFHRPGEVRADDWLYREMESPWAGEGRGLALQRIWSKEGRLLASCVQEGLVRLKQDNTALNQRSKL